MKQFKVSWLIALAVVFALASAFTTDHLNKARVNELWYANDAHNPGNPLSPSDVNPAVSYTDAQLTPTFLATHCPTSTIICLAKFQQGPTGSQIAFKPGRYQ